MICSFVVKYNQYISMAKLYTQTELATPKMLPKKETVNFILNFSKAFHVVKVGNKKFEIIAN